MTSQCSFMHVLLPDSESFWLMPMMWQLPLQLTISCSSKSILVLPSWFLPFWYWLTQVVPDKIQTSHKTIVCVWLLLVYDFSSCCSFKPFQILIQQPPFYSHCMVVLCELYPQLRTGRFWRSRVLLFASHCWWQPMHLDLGRRRWSPLQWCYMYIVSILYSVC